MLCSFLNILQLVLSALFAAACAAPSNYAATPLIGHPGLVGHPQAYAHAVRPATISLPAPYKTSQQAPAVTSIHNPAPIVTEQIHLGQTSYISGHITQILKPAIPDFRIAVPTALKGTQSVNAPIVTVQKEVHTVDEPYPVEKPYNVPYDVIKPVQRIIEVPTAVHVPRPYPVAQPYPVQGETIVKKTYGAPVVRHHHSNVVAQPTLVAHHGYAAAPLAHHAYAAAPVAQHAYAVGAAPVAVVQY
jgi:hypothetical protein